MLNLRLHATAINACTDPHLATATRRGAPLPSSVAWLQELANTVWAAGKLGCVHTDFLAAAARASEAHLQRQAFAPQELTNVLYGYASLSTLEAGSSRFKPPVTLLDDAVDAVRLQLAQYSAQELSLVAWSLSELGYKPRSKERFAAFLEELAAALVARLRVREDTVLVQHVSNTLVALSRCAAGCRRGHCSEGAARCCA